MRVRGNHKEGKETMSIVEQTSTMNVEPLYTRMSEATKATVVRELQQTLGKAHVLYTPYDVALYEYDASIERARPDIVVLPSNNREVAEIVKIASRYHVPVVPRGAGTGLSGGAIPIYGGIVIAFA